MIPAFVAAWLLHRALAFGHRRSIGNCLLVATEPSIPAVLLWDNPTPDEPLRGFSQVSLIAQDRLRISQLVDLQHRMTLGE
jgi:hypothetical protein